MPKVTPHQLNLMTDGTVDLYRELESEIFRLVAQRLRTEGEVDIAAWQMEKLQQLHLLNADVIQELAKVSGRASDEIERFIRSAGYAIVDDTDNYFEKPLPYSSRIDLMMEGFKNQVFRDVNNFVNQTLISTNYGTGKVAEMYTDIINKSATLFNSGMVTLDKAIQRTINQWVDKGIQSSFVDKGGHTWSMERYVATVLRSTMQRTYNEVRTSRMAEYGCYTVLVGSLASARPDCAYCQGQVLDVRPQEQADSGYPSVYNFGYGSPGGHRGVNCRHPWFPFVPGVSTNNQPQYDPEDAIENGRIEAGRQQLAGRIRNTKKKLMIAEELGAANTGKYKRQLLEQQAQMREYVQRHNLRRNYRLEKVYTPRQNVVDGGYKAILTKADKVRATAQYEKYKSILGDKAPKTLDDYINIKYNGGEKYKTLKHDARVVSYFSGDIKEPLSESQKKQAVEAYFNFKNDGILFGDHGIARYVERMRRKNGTLKYNYQAILNIFEQEPLYTSSRGANVRDVRFNDNVIVYSEQGKKEVVSMVLRSSKKKGKDIPHKDWTVISGDSN